MHYLWLYPTYQSECRPGLETSGICTRIETIHVYKDGKEFMLLGDPSLGITESETLAVSQFCKLLEGFSGNVNLLGWDPTKYLADIVNIAISLGFTLPAAILNDIRVRYTNVNTVPVRSIYTQNMDFHRGDIKLEDALSFWTGGDYASTLYIMNAKTKERNEAVFHIFTGMITVLKRYGGSIDLWLK